MSPIWYGDLGACVYPICLGVFWGHQYIFQAFLCLLVHPVASQFITVIPVASHHYGLLLYWTGWLWMSAMLHAVVHLFVVFIMSQASTTIAKTPTPLVTVVCSSASSLLLMVTIAPYLMGLPATSGQHDVVLPPLLMPSHSGGVGLAIVLQQQPPSQMPLQAFVNYAMGPPHISTCISVSLRPEEDYSSSWKLVYLYNQMSCSREYQLTSR